MNSMSNPASTWNALSQRVTNTYREAVRDYTGTYINPLLDFAFNGVKPAVKHQDAWWPVHMVPECGTMDSFMGKGWEESETTELSRIFLSLDAYHVFEDELVQTSYEGFDVRFRYDSKMLDALVKLHGEKSDHHYYLAGDSCSPLELEDGSGWAVPILHFENLVSGYCTDYVCCIVDVYEKDKLIRSIPVHYTFSTYFEDEEED